MNSGEGNESHPHPHPHTHTYMLPRLSSASDCSSPAPSGATFSSVAVPLTRRQDLQSSSSYSSASAVVVPHWNRNCGTISLPIESAVAGASCTATIANCEPDVLASVSWMDSYTVFSNIHRLNFSARNFGRS